MKATYTTPQTTIATTVSAMSICRVSADGNVRVNNTETLTGIKIE